jgi:hypothetical protein
MFYSQDDLRQKAEKYCHKNNLQLGKSLGHGLQGIVFVSDQQSAIKVHASQVAYLRERDAYKRLSKNQVRQVRELIVPTLRAFDDSLLIIEMSLVSPPFIVDFGGAYLDELPVYARDPEVRARWTEERQEQFGDNISMVNAILADLQTLYGIFLSDVHSGNIRFDKVTQHNI